MNEEEGSEDGVTFETVDDQLSIFHASFLFSRRASNEG